MAIKKRLFVIYTLWMFLVPIHLMQGIAQAHVLIADTTSKSGAVLHVTPGDDPVAGAKTGIYYEIDASVKLDNADIKLVVSSDTGGIEEKLPIEVDKQSISAAFNFPSRGLYYLQLTITTNTKKVVTFYTSQRVTKSLKGTDPAINTPTWAKIGLLFSVWALTLVVIVASRRRKVIVKKSR